MEHVFGGFFVCLFGFYFYSRAFVLSISHFCPCLYYICTVQKAHLNYPVQNKSKWPQTCHGVRVCVCVRFTCVLVPNHTTETRREKKSIWVYSLRILQQQYMSGWSQRWRYYWCIEQPASPSPRTSANGLCDTSLWRIFHLYKKYRECFLFFFSSCRSLKADRGLALWATKEVQRGGGSCPYNSSKYCFLLHVDFTFIRWGRIFSSPRGPRCGYHRVHNVWRLLRLAWDSTTLSVPVVFGTADRHCSDLSFCPVYTAAYFFFRKKKNNTTILVKYIDRQWVRFFLYD